MSQEGFSGLRVLTLESRRAQEMAKLIANAQGRPVIAPSMREVPIESNTHALEFVSRLLAGRLDMVIFLTGVGTRIARGPKPAAVLREMEVPISLLVPEPNTWRELLRALDENPESLAVRDRRVAVQEYGVSNPELLAGLSERGASVTCVPVYKWMLPEDTGPLRAAITALILDEIDAAMFTSSAQVRHLLQVATEMGVRDNVLQAFARIVVASIGPMTSEELDQHGIAVDIEPTHPKMGFFVRETADRSAALLKEKRNSEARSVKR